MKSSSLNYGQEVTLEVKVRRNTLPGLFSNETPTEIYKGILQRKAAYDDKDTVRLLCKRYPLRVRVIALKNVVKLNNQAFHFEPAQKLVASPAETSTVEVKGSNNKKYTLTLFKNGRIYCTCPGFGFRGKCRHVDEYLDAHGK